jgi:hypothetical protein
MKLEGKAGSAGHAVAEHYKPKLLKLRKKDQVFSADEMGLFYKMTGNRMYIAKEQKMLGFKAFKNRLTLIVCENTSNDFKCKPLLVYHSENPHIKRQKTSKLCLSFGKKIKGPG